MMKLDPRKVSPVTCQHLFCNYFVGVAISPDGRFVAAGSLDCVVRLWDTQTGKHVESFKGHDDSVYSVAFSPDGKTLASGSLDKVCYLLCVCLPIPIDTQIVGLVSRRWLSLRCHLVRSS